MLTYYEMSEELFWNSTDLRTVPRYWGITTHPQTKINHCVCCCYKGSVCVETTRPYNSGVDVVCFISMTFLFRLLCFFTRVIHNKTVLRWRRSLFLFSISVNVPTFMSTYEWVCVCACAFVYVCVCNHTYIHTQCTKKAPQVYLSIRDQ